MNIVKCLLLFFGFLAFASCESVDEKLKSTKFSDLEKGSNSINDLRAKQRGAHVFGRMDSTKFNIIHRNNIEWVTIVPWGFQTNYNSTELNHHRGDSTNIKERNKRTVSRMELLHNSGFKVFLKPHIWIQEPDEGKWRSDIYPETEADWKIWKEDYKDFILRYAKVAEHGKAEMFCIGTELSRLSVEKPKYWFELIKEIKQIYSGKITYAANWYKEYEQITFWKELDYIGIQAYFPLSSKLVPSSDELCEGWEDYMPTLKSISETNGRKIIFSEMGYKSTADSAIKPWEWIEEPENQGKPTSVETQANCYDAFFKTIWKQPWFAGVHLWQIRLDASRRTGSMQIKDFTPIDKPAEKIIANGFYFSED